MDTIQVELVSLAQHLSSRREAILQAWQGAIRRDPELTTSDSLPRAQLVDHIPALLSTFEGELCRPPASSTAPHDGVGQEPAAAHGLQRWRQGYDLREVTRELGKLNECVIAELDRFTLSNVGQYFELQQAEAAGQLAALESALAELQELEQQRADLWRQAAHDLRGNLGVVANATVGLTQTGLRDASRDDFVRILMRNVTSLHHLLEDVTSLARLQAGSEHRRIELLDVTPIMQQLCEGIRPLAQHHHLFLRCDGPQGFAAEGDAVKIRRIAQNLILNAVKFTREGGITVSWGDSEAGDPKRWALTIQDTGPGFHAGAGEASALEAKPGTPGDAARAPEPSPSSGARAADPEAARDASGEGLGLSIVKRLCDMLDASIEIKSVQGKGTTFRILFPRQYS
jgi:signal transduction histidine kinase